MWKVRAIAKPKWIEINCKSFNWMEFCLWIWWVGLLPQIIKKRKRKENRPTLNVVAKKKKSQIHNTNKKIQERKDCNPEKKWINTLKVPIIGWTQASQDMVDSDERKIKKKKNRPWKKEKKKKKKKKEKNLLRLTWPRQEKIKKRKPVMIISQCKHVYSSLDHFAIQIF